jgi:beta-phosphoglucomutase
MKDRSAVIFDMDGVLVDSYHAHYLSWLHMAQPSGLTFTEAEFGATFGRTSREIIEHFWGKGRFSGEEIALMDAAKEAAYRAIVACDFPAMPGAKETIVALHAAGFRLGIGSSGPPENVDLALDRLGIRPWIGAAVTGQDVTRGKPDPQVFLLTAERLGVHPARCVVVEDAPAGIAAAHAAGMAAVGFVSTGRTREGLAEADCLIRAFRELTPELIRGCMRESLS